VIDFIHVLSVSPSINLSPIYLPVRAAVARVGYGGMNPATFGGRATATFLMAIGLCLTSLMVGSIANALAPLPFHVRRRRVCVCCDSVACVCCIRSGFESAACFGVDPHLVCCYPHFES
jgi:hypothetical protein